MYPGIVLGTLSEINLTDTCDIEYCEYFEWTFAISGTLCGWMNVYTAICLSIQWYHVGRIHSYGRSANTYIDTYSYNQRHRAVKAFIFSVPLFCVFFGVGIFGIFKTKLAVVCSGISGLTFLMILIEITQTYCWAKHEDLRTAF